MAGSFVRRLSSFALLLAASGALAQPLPETFLKYSIDVTLDPVSRTLNGRETIRWTNPSKTVSVERVPLHLYLNAFSNDASSWMSSQHIESVLDLHDDPWGWIEPRIVRQDAAELTWRPIAPDDGNPFDRSLIELELAVPVPPGETLTLEIEFDARLPVPIARTGGFDDFFFVAQWFPKIAVFETAGIRGATTDGWNAHQFHGSTEFYADYADFEVGIGLPTNWRIAATGQTTGMTERDGIAVHRFAQRAVHDFAFAAGETMVDAVSVHDPVGSGAPVELHVFLPADHEAVAPRWRGALERSLDVLGSRVGGYPYPTITVVLPPYRQRGTAGMEYPTLVTAFFGDAFWELPALDGARVNEYAIAHEFAHQYFYGLIGSNEFEEAFLDEGFAEYWSDQIMLDGYPDGVGNLLGRAIDVWDFERFIMEAGDDGPAIGSLPSFIRGRLSPILRLYSRPALTMRTIERRHGRELVDAIFAAYFERWRFRHPSFEDFVAVAREVAGDTVADFVVEAYTQEASPDFTVEEFSVEVWRPPGGRVVMADGIVAPGDDRERLAALAKRAAGAAGTIVVERLDSGDPLGGRRAAIERFTVEPNLVAPDSGFEPDDENYESEVRLSGPGWRHLPVDVDFRFADGRVYRDAWDGRSTDRVYRFVSDVPLAEASIDAERLIALDLDRANNARQREAHGPLVWSWALWIGGTAQLLLEGLSQWL